MVVTDPLCNEPSFSIPWSIATICILKFLDRSCSLVVKGVPPHQRRRQTPCSAQTGTTNYDLFSPLLSIVASQEMTIKHLMYTQKVPFLYTERACVLFSRFWNSSSVYSTRHLSSAEDKNFPFCPHLRTQKTHGKQMLLSKLSSMAYLTMVVLPS